MRKYEVRIIFKSKNAPYDVNGLEQWVEDVFIQPDEGDELIEVKVKTKKDYR